MNEIKSALMTSALVAQAFKNILPLLEKDLENKDRATLCFHAIDPCATVQRVGAPVDLWCGTAGADDAASVKNYPMNAKKKTHIVWKTGMSTTFLRADYPHLFEKGDFKYDGGVNYKGIVVGASGMTQEDDARWALKLATEIHSLLLVAAAAEFKKSTHHILEVPPMTSRLLPTQP